MLNIDSYAYNSKLSNSNPTEKLLFSLSTMFLCIYSNSIYIYIGILLFMSYFAVVKGGVSLSLYLKLLLVPAAFLITGVLTIAINKLDSTTGALLYIEIFNTYIGSTSETLFASLRIFCKSLGAVSCLYFLTVTTPMTNILLALKKLKVPVLFIELMSLVYYFIFILLNTSSNIIISQSSRLGYFNFKSSIKSITLLCSNLFIKSYKRSFDTFTALEARGYTGYLNVIEEDNFKEFLSIPKILFIESLLIILSILL